MIASDQTPQLNSNQNLPHNRSPLHNQSQKPLWQNPWLKIAVAVVTLITILVVMNFTIKRYETHLQTGEVVLLELAPVDPRGFMQGDYMRLRFAMGDEIYDMISEADDDNTADKTDAQAEDDDSSPPLVDGYAIVKKDANNVGHLVRIIETDALDSQTLGDDELPLYFRVRGWHVKFATNAFFFQEGHAPAYESAEYGMFRVNDKGEPLLTSMVDESFNVIEGVDEASDGNINSVE